MHYYIPVNLFCWLRADLPCDYVHVVTLISLNLGEVVEYWLKAIGRKSSFRVVPDNSADIHELIRLNEVAVDLGFGRLYDLPF